MIGVNTAEDKFNLKTKLNFLTDDKTAFLGLSWRNSLQNIFSIPI